MARPLTVESNEDARDKGWQVVIADPDQAHVPEGDKRGWELIQKAWYEDDDERVLHTTKRLRVPGGWLYDVYSEILHKGTNNRVAVEPGDDVGHSVSVARSCTFVPAK